MNRNERSEKQPVQTPKVIGLTVEKAKEVLQPLKLKLRIKARKPSLVWKEGIIISQLPSPGEETQKNSTVFVIVSSGKPVMSSAVVLPTITTPTLLPATQTSTKSSVAKTSKPVKNNFSSYTVCLDPGHQAQANLEPEPIGPGASQTKPKVAGGATGVVSKTPESLIVLKIALKLKDKLESKGINVVMVRTRQDVNISNSQRAQIANNAQAALFVRIHLDSSANHSISGITTLYPARNQWTKGIYQPSKEAAEIIHPFVITETGANDRGLKERGDMTGFNWSRVPVILIEAGFLSNPTEDRKLNTSNYQDKIATGLYKGIIKFLGNN